LTGVIFYDFRAGKAGSYQRITTAISHDNPN
jgi:hypothetical protein